MNILVLYEPLISGVKLQVRLGDINVRSDH
jgi:hypothetical protein